MKYRLFIAGLALFIMGFSVQEAFAIYNFSNSASYTRTQSRNATTATVDSVYYNPAGLVKLADGFYVDLGNQFGAKKYSHVYRAYNREFADTTFIPLLPNMALVYKKDKASAFFALDIPAGGGELNYKDKYVGLPSVTAGFPQVTATFGQNAVVRDLYINSFWIRGTLGGSYALTDTVSMTGGIKYAKKVEWRKAHAMWTSGAPTGSFDGVPYPVLDTYTSLSGFGAFFGGMLSPSDMVKITALYQTEITARGTTLDKLGGPKKYAKTATEDALPAYVALGIALKPGDAVEIQLSYDYVFSGEQKLGSQANFGTTTGWTAGGLPYPYYLNGTTLMAGNYYHKKMKDQMRIGLGFEFNLGKVKPSLGASYITPDTKSSVWNSALLVNPELFELCVGLVAAVSLTDTLSLDISGAKHWYRTEKFAFGTNYIKKDIWNFGLGLTWKLI